MASDKDTTSQNSSFGCSGGIIVILLVLLLGAVTNPDLGKHQRKIEAHLEQENPLLNLFGASSLASSAVTYNDYTVFSTTKYDGDVLTVGAAGQVFLREELVDKVEKLTDEQNE